MSFGYKGSRRGGGQAAAELKLAKIVETLPSTVKTAVDVGANTGFFSIALAKRGIFTHAFEPNHDLYSAMFSVVHQCSLNTISLSMLKVTKETRKLLPSADCVLILSVMHYWVEEYGWDGAIDVLSDLWKRTNQVLYFEIPNPVSNTKMENILTKMGSTPEECQLFIFDMLNRLPKSSVTFLDYIQTDFRPGEWRHLFRVERHDN